VREGTKIDSKMEIIKEHREREKKEGERKSERERMKRHLVINIREQEEGERKNLLRVKINRHK
jgi:hypothetical protein